MKNEPARIYNLSPTLKAIWWRSALILQRNERPPLTLSTSERAKLLEALQDAEAKP